MFPAVIALLACSTIAAVLAILVSRWLTKASNAKTSFSDHGSSEAPRVYEFRDGYLVSDASESDVFLADPTDRAGAWSALSDVLVRVNPQIRSAFDVLQRAGHGFLLSGQAGQDELTVSGTVNGDVVQITVANAKKSDGKILLDAESFRQQRIDAEGLRQTADSIAVVAWRETRDGQITWANASYFRYLESSQDDTAVLRWPPRQLFGKEIRPLPEPGQSRRCALEMRNRKDPMWFEISAQPSGDEILLTALPAERLVAAEDALRDFVQTLSKTFADLPIGLAIFDRRRELVLFNPALVSLSTIDAKFLSARPTLYSFLDQLREKRQMPEPKNYKAWRESIAQLEADAEEGTYHDLWTLPMGQTYRVIGRPHPDGAIAFMFEDISAEVSLTRQFRADLDLYQAAIDQDEMALAVFSAQGQLVMSNTAYADLWGHDPRELLGVLTLKEATQRWEAVTMPAPLWGEVRDFANQRQDRVVWTDLMLVPGQGELFTRVSPLKGGATMLSFEVRTPQSLPVEPA
ncbi:MAG: PAS-domain containing protein [Pseudomonadota bacterium]